jgi:hypothetical protein
MHRLRMLTSEVNVSLTHRYSPRFITQRQVAALKNLSMDVSLTEDIQVTWSLKNNPSYEILICTLHFLENG